MLPMGVVRIPECEDCDAPCCRLLWLELSPVEQATGKWLRDPNPGPEGQAVMAKRANGDCVYFGAEGGCTIYQDRPSICCSWVCFWSSYDEDTMPREMRSGGCILVDPRPQWREMMMSGYVERRTWLWRPWSRVYEDGRREALYLDSF